jgi:hypothetical protein
MTIKDAEENFRLHKTAARPELYFDDGCGIMGPDMNRTPLATFNRADWPRTAAEHYGPLFAASPDLLRELQIAVEMIELNVPAFEHDTRMKGFYAAIKKAKGE